MKNVVLGCLVFSFLCACSAQPAATTLPPVSSPTGTPVPLVTRTPTIVWFPPTITPTPFPTPVITPTPDMLPQLGNTLLRDNFSTPGTWTLTQSQQGSVAFGKDELTIAIGEDNAYLYSVRSDPSFSDFYLEITAQTSLCHELDEYGVLFRVSPANDFYRFSLSCNGQVRLDRVSGGQASSPQPWLLSGAVPPGAPSSARIGISAVGSEMRFFVNGQYQFTAKDPLLTGGAVGVFARSTQKMAVTVNFSDLVIYAIIP